MILLSPTIGWLPRPSAASAYILLLWNVGSRHDPPGQEGLLHFLEHTLFKGTQRHRSREIFSRIERHGGELNAFTTKDKMALEARVAPFAVELALATLYELAHEAIFPEKEVEKEREVILEELAMYEDIPEESLLDHFEEQVFTEGGLRHPIIGYPESVRSLSASALRSFYTTSLQSAPWALLLTGPLRTQDIEKALRRTGWLTKPAGTSPTPSRSEHIAPSSTQVIRRATQQAHLVIGGIGPSLYDWSASLPLQLLLHELGGPQMTSRLNTLLREKNGWCYTIYAFLHGYPEKTVWGFYAGLSPETIEKARSVIYRELSRYADKPVSSSHLSTIKRAFLGKSLLSWESASYRLLIEGRYLLDKGIPFSPQAWKETLLSLSSATLQEAAQKAFSHLYDRSYLPLSS